jgi:Tol biopolymer transport system component/predicted Ser/Thr protein kinase
MPLSPGDKLGPYEILDPIGAGGMGDVYKARDTRLDRIVAIKVSKTEFSERFEREARAVASLNHPHICSLYDVGPNYLVMEYVEGVPLKGPLPVEQALKYAGEICEALAEAHSKGVTHRDLKPANILVTKTSGIKLLDFGLAKVQSAVTADDETLTMALTAKGQILGTVFYMSPEQVQGQEAGPASDIFSFGLVLYEMLTGKRAFEGKSAASVIAAILERPAPSVADVAPASLDRVLRRSLEKDPDNRWRSAHDLGAALECVNAVDTTTIAPGPPQKPSAPTLPWALVVALTAIAVALGFIAYRHGSEEQPRVLRVSILPPEKTVLPLDGVPALSPDGRRVAFAATSGGTTSLWIRDLDSLTARALPGTEGASLPFWSPDGKSLGFFAGANLKRTDAMGGSVLTLCEAPNGRGGAWNQNDVILFVPGILSPVFRVSAAGGTPTPLTALSEDELGHRNPWFLPDGRHFLYLAIGRGPSGSKRTVYVADLESNERLAIANGANSKVEYAAPGYLLFARETTLLAQPFSLSRLQTTGDPVVVAEHISYQSIDARALYTSSQTGILAYVPADAGGGARTSQLTWIDRSGKLLGTVGLPASFGRPAISPDGNSVATDVRDPQTGLSDIWMYDLARETASRFTFNSKGNTRPVWSPDGGHVAFTSTLSGPTNIYQKAVGGGPEEPLEKHPVPRNSEDWSRDGRYIFEYVLGKSNEIWVLPLFGDRKSFPYLQNGFNQNTAKLSPNGQWLAYMSDESKQNEVYVQTFPTPGGQWQISTNGGSNPVWSRDNKELFYIAPDRKMMAVDVNLNGGKFAPGVPKALFDTGLAQNAGYDVGKDGRFLIPRAVEGGASAPLTVVVNWTATLKK